MISTNLKTLTFVPLSDKGLNANLRNVANALLTGESIPGMQTLFDMTDFRIVFDLFRKSYSEMFKKLNESSHLAAFYTKNFCKVIENGNFDVASRAAVLACWKEWGDLLSSQGIALPPEAIHPIRSAMSVLMGDPASPSLTLH